MGITTDIAYADSTANFITGCQGCPEMHDPNKPEESRCFAYHLVSRYAGCKGWPESFDKPALFLDRLEKAIRWKDLTGTDRPDKPWLNGYPRIIFLNDLGDTFGGGVDFDVWLKTDLRELIPAMEKSPHIWLLLTKRPQAMKRFFDWYGHVPANFWLGVSITSDKYAHRAASLASISGASVRWISFEPLLGSVDLAGALDVCVHDSHGEIVVPAVAPASFIQWAVIGGESGPKCRPMDPVWALELAHYCDYFGIKWLGKQMGGHPDKRGRMEDLPVELQRRQMPRLISDLGEQCK